MWDGGGQGACPLEAVQALKAIHFWIWELFRNMHIYLGRRSEQGGMGGSSRTKRLPKTDLFSNRENLREKTLKHYVTWVELLAIHSPPISLKQACSINQQ